MENHTATAARLATAAEEFGGTVNGTTYRVDPDQIATHVLAMAILAKDRYSDDEYLEAYTKAEAQLEGRA